MEQNQKKIIGIDLGTTNCTVSFVNAEDQKIELFSIPQFSDPETIVEESALPSFLYCPLEEEKNREQLHLEWNQNENFCVGKYAKKRGAEISDRLITSSKSWLCHHGIDRSSPLLPLNLSEAKKISPIDASAKLLAYIKAAWNHKMRDFPFNEQEVYITVPASFDPAAKQLVLEAAKIAEYPEIVLLEEPQAAFYSWLYNQKEEWRKKLAIGDTILVVDIGGGTTDFSLIAANNVEGNLSLDRVAVGEHLLLGGDNIDLALAYVAKDKLEEEGHFIDEWQLHALQHAVRHAKEVLLDNSNSSIDEVPVTILGRGSRLIGNTLSTVLTKNEVEEIVLNGFFPLISIEERSKKELKVGISQIGLPYAADARVTAQLAKFLSMSGESDLFSKDLFLIPSAILFNGGSVKPQSIQKRILEAINGWAKELGREEAKILLEQNLDFAVSEGASYYGLVRKDKGVRIKSGISKSYFIGIQDTAPSVPGRQPPIKTICIAPYGMEEGSSYVIEDKEFALTLGEKAVFRFFCRSTPTLANGLTPTVGSILPNWKLELTELEPIEALMDKKNEQSSFVSVQLHSSITELGFLELWCESKNGNKWMLEFNVRE